MVDLEALSSLMSVHRPEDNSFTSVSSASYETALQYTVTEESRESSFSTLTSCVLHKESHSSVLPKLPIHGIPSPFYSNDGQHTDEDDRMKSDEYADSYSDSDEDSEMNEAVATVIRQLIDEPPLNFSTESLTSTETSTPRRKKRLFRFLFRGIQDTSSSTSETHSNEKVTFFRRLFRKLTYKPA